MEIFSNKIFRFWENFHLVGYFDRRPSKEFSFIIPVFQSKKLNYRSEINRLNEKIESFSIFNGEFKKIQSETKVKVGDEAFYVIRYKDKYYHGNKAEIVNYLLRLLRYNQLNLIDQFNIYSFFGLNSETDIVIKKLIENYKTKSINLSKENFYNKPKEELNIFSFSNVVYSYSKLIEKSRSMLNITDFFYCNDNPIYVYFGDFKVKKSILRNKFESLIKISEDYSYRDIICYCFALYDIENVNSFDKRNYRIRKHFEIKPIEINKENRNFSKLIENSQSNFVNIDNITVASKEIEDRICSIEPSGKKGITKFLALRKIEKIKDDIKELEYAL